MLFRKPLLAEGLSVLNYNKKLFILTTQHLSPPNSPTFPKLTPETKIIMKNGSSEEEEKALNEKFWENEYEKHIRDGVKAFQSYVENWYNGSLQTVFFAENSNETIKAQICSVLAGYVWDRTNPFVKRHDTAITNLARMIQGEAAERQK